MSRLRHRWWTRRSAVPAPVDSTDAIEIFGVHKAYGRLTVLDGIDLRVRRGEVLAIIGPSGSGKSTLLRCINHLEKVDQGLILVGAEPIGYRLQGTRLHGLSERDILRQRVKVGFVFQNFNLFGHLTVLQNVIEAPVSAQRRPRSEVVDRARELLDAVGVADKADAYPRQLSGGQQQRVAIARALALDPEVLLFDEPTSALDPELVGEVLAAIRDLAAQGRTLVIVTHEIGFTREIADQVVFMDQGLVVEQGPPEQVLDHPTQERTRAFLQAVL